MTFLRVFGVLIYAGICMFFSKDMWRYNVILKSVNTARINFNEYSAMYVSM